jgi:hypothetical protein
MVLKILICIYLPMVVQAQVFVQEDWLVQIITEVEEVNFRLEYFTKVLIMVVIEVVNNKVVDKLDLGVVHLLWVSKMAIILKMVSFIIMELVRFILYFAQF